MRYLLTVRADIPELALKAGDVLIVEPGAEPPVTMLRTLPAWAYGLLGGALADGLIDPPPDVGDPLAALGTPVELPSAAPRPAGMGRLRLVARRPARD